MPAATTRPTFVPETRLLPLSPSLTHFSQVPSLRPCPGGAAAWPHGQPGVKRTVVPRGGVREARAFPQGRESLTLATTAPSCRGEGRGCHNHVSKTVLAHPTEGGKGGISWDCGPFGPLTWGPARINPVFPRSPQPYRCAFCPPTRAPTALGRCPSPVSFGPARPDGADGVHRRWGSRGLSCGTRRGQRPDWSLQRGKLRARPACCSAGEQRAWRN